MTARPAAPALPPTTAADDVAAAIAGARRHEAGRIGAVEQACRQALVRTPDDTEALHLLGVVALQAGRPHEAIGLLTQAVALRPDRAPYLCNLGEAHRAVGELAQAQACQRQALALDPALAEAHHNLGLLQQAQAQSDEPAPSRRQALAQFASAKKQVVAPPLNSSTIGRAPGSNSPSRRTSVRVASSSGKRAR
jgi:tetratricopeptide (TPR) repeat protein